MSIFIDPIGIGIKDAAAIIGVSIPTLKRLKREGEIPFSKVRGRIIFRPKQLEAYLERKEAENIK